MNLENNSFVRKGLELTENINSRLEAFFSSKYFIFFLFLYVLFYFFIGQHFTRSFISDKTYLNMLVFLVSGISIFLLFRFKKVYPFVSAGAILIFASFFSQRFDLIVEYNLLYFIGFGLLSASLVYSLIEKKKTVFWLSLFILFISTLAPLITSQILIGDERVLLDNLTKLESGKFSLADFGKHNYVNVSFVYFYYLVIIAKIFGTSAGNLFFLFKLFFLLLIFLSFYLVSTRFLDEKLALFAVLIAFFPIQNIHLAPQMIGKFMIFLVFIYFYLKYFKQLNSRIIIVVMMLIVTYINLTTLYIAIAVFGFFVAIFFFSKAISRKAYFTDIAILLLFTVLVATYSTSINLFGLTKEYAGISGENLGSILDENKSFLEEEKVVREEQLNPRANPLTDVLGLQEKTTGQLIPESVAENVPFMRRLVPFINNYANNFGVEQLIDKLIHYFLVSLLVLTAFFVYPGRRQIFVFSIGVLFLVLFLIHIQFQDGVHATLEVTSLILGVCIILVFHKKPLYFIPIMLLVLSSLSAPAFFTNSQYGEASELFSSEFAPKNILYADELIPITRAGAMNSPKQYAAAGFSVTCTNEHSYGVYLNDVFVRCDNFSRIGSLGKKVFETSYSKVYVVTAGELDRFRPKT
ncbi:MAG: hypothetical protein ABH986_03530 [archaeon]